MQIKIDEQKAGSNIFHLMRKIGYLELRDRRTSQVGYVRKIGAGFYPRFHAHASYDPKNNLILDLHFENYKPMHKQGTSRVENDGAVLEQEGERIKMMLGLT